MPFPELDKLKKELDLIRPLPAAALRNLEEVYRVEWTYHSNAIEGNTLTLLETKLVLEEGLTIGGKKLREHFEVINHAEAIQYVKEIVDGQSDLSEQVIESVHHLVLKNIDDNNAGRYRHVNIRISGSRHIPPHYMIVQEQMEQLMAWYEVEKLNLHPIELAALFHFRFVYIHPFADGNGRTARLLMNLILMRHGYPPAIVKADPQLRMVYYESLEKASTQGDVAAFVALIAENAKESLLRYLESVK